MKREILISQEANEKRVAILEDGRLEELYMERSDHGRMFGNIYKGKVKTVIKGIGAAFVDLGTKKDGFLYVADALQNPLDPELDGDSGDIDDEEDDEDEAEGNGRPQKKRRRHHQGRERMKSIDEVLKIGQEVIVQVVKEAIRNKGPRLTTHFSIPARYLVMMPGESKVGISRRIEDRKERDRIRQIFESMELPKGVGFIVRTAGEGKSEKEFARDIRYLTRQWARIEKGMNEGRAPNLIHQELDLVERVIRDHLTDETDKIVVDNKDLFHRVKRFVGIYLQGGHTLKVEMYKGNESLFEKFNVEKEIEATFQRNVYLKSGGHIVIEQTESLVAIDVNTGKFTGTRNLEETVYKNNMEAAWEVARQLRLRDVGGIVIIDFIDMERHENRRNLMRAFKEAVRPDRAKINILPMSELGLVEMTRQRIKASHESTVHRTCPYCNGRGIVKSPTSMAIQTIRELRKALAHSSNRLVNAYVHPTVSERLLNQEKRALQQLESTKNSRIYVFSEPSMHLEDINITFVQ
ncbi:MAG TPA: Rne/Rng family ribonuclease [Verrucomicrobiae bacterium]|nr:Rne/Rng family ribonuclease [Verrucomicrobiae bacterium]